MGGRDKAGNVCRASATGTATIAMAIPLLAISLP